MESSLNNGIIGIKNNNFNNQIIFFCKNCKLPAHLILKDFNDIRINCPKNHEIQISIEELEQLYKDNSSKNLCSFCFKIYLLNELSFCQSCVKIICNECIKSHEFNHKFEKLNLIEKICVAHQNSCNYFCSECNTHICDSCVKSEHKLHSIINLINNISNKEIDEIQIICKNHEKNLKNEIEEYQTKLQKLREEIDKPIKKQKQILSLVNIVNKIYTSNKMNYHNIENMCFIKNKISDLLINEQKKLQNFLLNDFNFTDKSKNEIKIINSINSNNNEIVQINENVNDEKSLVEFGLVSVNNKEKNIPLVTLTNPLKLNHRTNNQISLNSTRSNSFSNKNYNNSDIKKFYKVKNETYNDCTVSNAIQLKKNYLLIALENQNDEKSKLVLYKIKFLNANSGNLKLLSEYNIEESPINHMAKFSNIIEDYNISILCCSNNFIYKIEIKFNEKENIYKIKELFKLNSSKIILLDLEELMDLSFKICFPINYKSFLTAGTEKGLILWRQNKGNFSEEKYRDLNQPDYTDTKITAIERIDSKNIVVFCIELDSNKNKNNSSMEFLEVNDEKLLHKKKYDLDEEIQIDQNNIIKYDKYLLISYSGKKKGILLFNRENMIFEINSEIEKMNAKISENKFTFENLMVDDDYVIHYNTIKLNFGNMIFKEYVIGQKKEGKVNFELKDGIFEFNLPSENNIVKFIYINKKRSMKILGVQMHILLIDENGVVISN